MSRIHEALKKAAQDRAQGSDNGTSCEVVEVPTEIRPAVLLEQARLKLSQNVVESPQFEEF
jgi:hypothetical protein